MNLSTDALLSSVNAKLDVLRVAATLCPDAPEYAVEFTAAEWEVHGANLYHQRTERHDMRRSEDGAISGYAYGVHDEGYVVDAVGGIMNGTAVVRLAFNHDARTVTVTIVRMHIA